ncbi:MAG: porin [Betaproteobacteria bacterium]|nr:porin [Betaproteobacteria bacterium]
MKKTQVALAAMALVASTAVLADGVTVYGTVDASVIKSKDASATFSGSGQWGANAFGLRGSSDLENGMKIGFNLEAGVNSAHGGRDNGGANGATALNASTVTNTTDTLGVTGLFNRAANLSVTTAAGTITAGLQITPFIAAAAGNLGLAGNNFVVPYLVNAGAADTGGTGASATGGFFQPDAISYSNSAGAVSFSALTSTGGRAADVMNRYTGANVNFAISESTNVYAAYAMRHNAYTNWVAGIKHVAGDVTIAAQFINTSNKLNTNIINNTDTTGATTGTQVAADGSTYVLSAAYALGGGNTVGINYSNTDWSGSTTSGGTAPANSRTLTNLSFAHAMSKSTLMYAFYGRGQGSALTSYASTGDTTMGVGISTNF